MTSWINRKLLTENVSYFQIEGSPCQLLKARNAESCLHFCVESTISQNCRVSKKRYTSLFFCFCVCTFRLLPWGCFLALAALISTQQTFDTMVQQWIVCFFLHTEGFHHKLQPSFVLFLALWCLKPMGTFQPIYAFRLGSPALVICASKYIHESAAYYCQLVSAHL